MVEFDIKKHLRCPTCRGELTVHTDHLFCRQCSVDYAILDEIIDLYPCKTPFRPVGTDLQHQYETFGESISRPQAFQHRMRKDITLEFVEGDILLEIGAAEGWMTAELAERARFVVSCDVAFSYLQRAQSAGINADFIRLDAHSLPFEDNLFDCVLLTEVLEHLYCPYRALEEIHRVLKPNGFLILSTPNNMTFSGILIHLMNREPVDRDAHLSFYDPVSLKRLLGFAGFEIIKCKTGFIYFPLFKPLFHSTVMQKISHLLFKNFGNKIIVKATRSDKSLWTEL